MHTIYLKKKETLKILENMKGKAKPKHNYYEKVREEAFLKIEKFTDNNIIKNHLLDELELRPEFIEKINEIKKQKSFKVNDFAKRYNLKHQ